MKPLNIVEAVDARSIFDIGAVWILVSLAKTHQRFVGPGVLVVDPGFR